MTFEMIMNDREHSTNAIGTPLTSSTTVFGESPTLDDAFDRSEEHSKALLFDNNAHLDDAWWKIWWKEILMCIAGVATSVGLVYFLKSLDGAEEMQRKGVAGLSANSVVAIFTTTLRICLGYIVVVVLSQEKWNWLESINGRPFRDVSRFNSASTGMDGSFRMLFGNYKIWSRSPVAALGSLTTITLLPLSTFSQQVLIQRLADGVAEPFPRCNSYHRWAENARNEIDWDYSMRTAISSAIGNTSVQLPDALCTSKHCSWKSIPSLAICGSCQNVTDSVALYCYSEIENPYQAEYSGTVDSPGRNCHYRLFDSDSELPYSTNRMINAKVQPRPALNSLWDDQHHLNSNITVARFTIMTRPQGATLVEATLCQLQFCIEVADVDIRNGVQKKTVMRVYQNQSTIEANAGPEIPRETVEWYRQINKGLHWRQWTITNPFGDGIAKYYESSYNPFNWSALRSTNDLVESVVRIKDFMSFQDWIQIVASKLSSQLVRDAPAPIDDKYVGISEKSLLLYHVRWWWLVYPASNVVACIILLFIAMWRTARTRTPAWKDDMEPLLRCELDPLLLRADDTADHNVRLQRGREGWQIACV